MISADRRLFLSKPTQTYLKRFSPRQFRLLGMLADPMDKRTLLQKARAAGVCRRTLFNWRKLPGWQEAELFLWRAKLDVRLYQSRERIERDEQHILWYGKRLPEDFS